MSFRKRSRKSLSTGRHSIDNKRLWGTLRAKGRLLIEGLEDRLMFAAFTDANPALSLSLATNDAVHVTANASTYTLNLTSGTWNGTDGANVTGNGTTTLTVQKAAFNQVNLTDGSGAAPGTSVTFDNSGANSYASGFSIALTNAAAGPIAFNGATIFTGASDLSASTSDFIVANPGSSITTASGSITLSANQQATPRSGNFIGINVNNATIQSAAGAISLAGKGGDTGINNFGVEIQAGGKVSETGATPALVSITGSANDATSAAIAFNNGAVTTIGSATFTANDGSITHVAAAAGPDITAANGVTFTTTGSNSAIGTSSNPIRTAIGALTATTNDGGIFIADSNAAMIVNSVLAKESGQAPFIDGTNQIVVLDPTNPHSGTTDVSISAQGDIVLNSVTAPDVVTVTSVAGSILDLDEASNNILARNVNFVADGAVGQDSNPIESTVEAFSASTTSGGIYLAQGIVSTAVSVVAGGANNGVVLTSSAASLSVQTVTALGDVTVNSAGGSLLDANGPAMNITGQLVDLTGASGIGAAADPLETNATDLSATVSDPNAAIFIDEFDGLTSVAAKTNAGNVTINFAGGPLSFVASTQLLSFSGTAALAFETTAGDVKLGLVDAGSSDVSVTAFGAIADDTSDALVDLRGGTVTLRAGTGIGASGNEIDTDVATLDATTTVGDIAIREANALVLSASSNDFVDTSLLTGSDIDVRSLTGNLTLGLVSALGSVTLQAGGALLDGNDTPTDTPVNIIANTLALTASNGIGSSSDGLETSVNSLTAAGGSGGLFLANSETLTLTLTSATAGGAISVSTDGDLTLSTVTASGQPVTLTATGELIDGNAGTLNITAQSATLNGLTIGGSGDKIEMATAAITAATTTGGIFLSNSGANLALTATALGEAADIDINTTGNIVLSAVTAQGDTVKLRATGSIRDGNDPPLPVEINVTAKKLDIAAPGGIGTAANPLEMDVDVVVTADGGTPGAFITFTGPLLLTETALQAPGNGTLSFDAESITIENIVDNTATIAAGRSVVLRTPAGAIVFLDAADTIATSGAGTITVQAGTIAGSGAVAVLGNLKTAGGNILVQADHTITIGQLNAGTGDVTVKAGSALTPGIIIDGNGTALNIIAGTTTLSGEAPTAREAELDETFRIAEAAAASARADAEQVSADAFLAGGAILVAQQKAAQDAVNKAVQASKAADAAVAKQQKLVNAQAAAVVTAIGVAFGLGTVAEAAETAADGAQAIPLTGDGGAAAAANVANLAAGKAETAETVAAALLAVLRRDLVDKQMAAVAAHAAEFAAKSTLKLATAAVNAFKESASITQAAATKAAIVRDAAERIRDQAIVGRDQANVIATLANPLGLQVAGVINVTAGASDSCLQVVGDTALGQIIATGSVTLISTGAITNGALPGVPNILAPGLTITAANGIGTAANPLLTRVGTLNATNTGGGDIQISNTAGAPAALNITGASNTGGGSVVISNNGDAAAGQGITVSGPISTTGAGVVTINSGSPLTVTANVTSASAITLSAAETPGAGDDLTVNLGVTIQSTGSSVTLQGGDNITVPAGSTIQAAGTITITADHASADAAGANVVVTGTLIGTSALINVDAGSTDDDTFTVTPSALTPVTVDGGGGNDTLNFNADGLPVTIQGNVITALGRAPVTFANTEAVNLLNASGGGSVTLNAATGVADAVVLTGTAPGAGTYTENGGIPISFSGVTSFRFNGADQNDAIAVTPFATPVQQWNVALTVDGGGAQNTLTFNGASGVSENVTMQPSSRGAGQLIDTNAATNTSVAVINYVNNTNIILNGSSTGAAGDTDSLFINGNDPATGVSGNEDALANFQAAGDLAHPMIRVYDAGPGAVVGRSPSAAELADTAGSAANSLFNLQSLSNFGTIRFGPLGGNDLLHVAGAQSGSLASLAINYAGGIGDDSLIVDSTDGPVRGPINYDGGPGTNSMTLTGGTATSDTYTPGSQLGSGTSTLAFASGTESVSFQNVAPIFDQVGGSLAVNATNASNAITYQEGNDTTNTPNPAWGQVSVDNLDPINFTNKSTLTVNGLAGTDTFSFNNPNTPTGLGGVAVSGVGSTGSDVLVVNGVAATVGVDTAAKTITGATGTGGAVPISYNAIGTLTVNVGTGTALAVSNSNGFTYTPGAAADAGTVQTSTLPVNFTGLGAGKTLALTGSGAGASLVVNDPTANDVISVAATTGSVALPGHATITTASLANLTLNGLNGVDTFNVTGPLPYASTTLAGGGAAVANLNGNGADVTANLGSTTSSVSGGGLGTISLPGIGTVNLNASAGNITLAGTSGSFQHSGIRSLEFT